MFKIDTNYIIPTHNELRVKSTAKRMFDDKSYLNEILKSQVKPILLVCTEDFKLWCLDGHHRLAAAHYHYQFIEYEYVKIEYYTYAELNMINLNVGYVTPFYVDVECRKSNFHDYKTYIMGLYNKLKLYQVENYEKIIKDLVIQFSDKYVENRTVFNMGQLCTSIL